MRLVSYRTLTGRPSVGVVDPAGDGVHDLARLVGPVDGLSPMRGLLAAGGADPSKIVSATDTPLLAWSEIVLQPPVPDPSKIVAAPVNYRDHQAEMSQSTAIEAFGLFLKAPSSLIADGETVRLPYTDRRVDQEAELGVVIGRTARHVDRADALAYVAGYTCLLDMTMRGGEDRSTRKSFDTFTPCGPALVTPDEAGPPERLAVRCEVNGTLRQHATVADLVWDVPQLIAYASSVMTLHPGDLIATGTPAGVGQVGDGDEITMEIGRIGTLRVSVDAQGAVPCPTRGANAGPVPPAEVTPVRTR